MSSEKCPLEGLIGPRVLTGDGEQIDTISLSAKKQIVFYFSAHWCPPCRNFTPILAKAYKEYQDRLGSNGGKANETTLLFCSWDSNKEEFSKYHKEMTFPALPFDPSKNQELGEKLGVEGIPTMVAVDPTTGSQLLNKDTVDLRALITDYGSDAFPLSPEHINELKVEAEAKARAMLDKLDSGSVDVKVSVTENKEETTLAGLLDQHKYVGLVIGDGDYTHMGDFYEEVVGIMKKANDNNGEGCFTLVYVPWTLGNEQCDHRKACVDFPSRVLDVSDDLRSALQGVAAGKVHPPMIFMLHRTKGLCKLDGTCESAGLNLVGQPMEVLMRLYKHGAEAFPWDDSAQSAFEAKKKAQIEALRTKLTDFEFLKQSQKSLLIKSDSSIAVDDFLSDAGDDGVIGLYFSAHWCPPCRIFTPQLLQCLEEVKGAGKKFEVIFCSSDKSKEEFDEYYGSMRTRKGDCFHAIDYDAREVKDGLPEVFEVDGIPTIVLLKPDGTIISKDGRRAIEAGAKYFPWDLTALESLEKDREEAKVKQLEKEKEVVTEQRQSEIPAAERLRGEPGTVEVNIPERTLRFDDDCFTTVGFRDLLTDSGILYFEIEIINDTGGLIQVGFSLEDGIEQCDEKNGDGVGDDEKSWAVDGYRLTKWHGKDSDWESAVEWQVGDVIGLAANVEMGKLAVSRNGIWEFNGLGVVFLDDSVKAGVYPSVTASGFKLRCNFEGELKHSLPSDAVWR